MLHVIFSFHHCKNELICLFGAVVKFGRDMWCIAVTKFAEALKKMLVGLFDVCPKICVQIDCSGIVFWVCDLSCLKRELLATVGSGRDF